MKNSKNVLYLGLLISIEVILTRFFAIQTPIVRIGFGFLPIAIAGMMFGPVAAGIAAMIADILGMAIFPKGAYFPGFTLSAFTTGAIYGLFLFDKQRSIVKIAAAVVAVTAIVDIGMNTVWISMITGKAAIVLMQVRVVKSLVMVPIQIFIINYAWKYLNVLVRNPLFCENKSA